MPILSILLVATACLPLKWPGPPAGMSPEDVLALTLAFMLLPTAVRAALSAVVVWRLKTKPDSWHRIARAYHRRRAWVNWFALLCAIIPIVVLGWGYFVWDQCKRDGILIPFAELLVPLPYILGMMLGWVANYPADRQIHHARYTGEPFPGVLSHVLYLMRLYLLMVMLPALLFAAQQSFRRWLPEWANSPWGAVSGIAVGLLFLVFLPLAFKPILGLKPMSPSPLRSRMEHLAKRLGVRFRDVLIWKMPGGVANAMVVGIIARARYCIFSDGILRELSPEELEAVLGHEAGHVKHHHVGFYLLFFLLSAAAGTSCILAFLKVFGLDEIELSEDQLNAVLLLPSLLMITYAFVVFGFVSRMCERQADVFACRSISCGDAQCVVHNETEQAPGLRPMCPTAIRLFVLALESVNRQNGGDVPSGRVMTRIWAWARAWQHGPVPTRVAFLRSLIHEPEREHRFQRRTWRTKLFLLASLVLVLAFMGSYVGWNKVLAEL